MRYWNQSKVNFPLVWKSWPKTVFLNLNLTMLHRLSNHINKLLLTWYELYSKTNSNLFHFCLSEPGKRLIKVTWSNNTLLILYIGSLGIFDIYTYLSYSLWDCGCTTKAFLIYSCHHSWTVLSLSSHIHTSKLWHSLCIINIIQSFS